VLHGIVIFLVACFSSVSANIATRDHATDHSLASGTTHERRFDNANMLALEMGHTDSEIIFNHCRQLVRPKEAERYWNTLPATKEKVVPLVAHT